MQAVFRSLLFVPGNRPDRFEKSAKAGADAVIIDLEDAVLPEDKASAREAALAALPTSVSGASLGIRINSPRTSDGCADIAAISESAETPAFIMVPKAETGIDIEIVREATGEAAPVMAVIESGRGLRRAFDIAKQSRGGVLFGGADYSASLGADLGDWGAMTVARGTIAGACGAAGVPAYDVPFLDVEDESGLAESTARAKAFGFAGRACIHPAQISTVNAVFAPSEADIEGAKAVLAAMDAAEGGAVLHKGKLVDRPVVLAAERVLAAAGQAKGQ
ncbi:MAG: CoA ester lyase [Pseudomonadota bacterium]